MGILAAKLTQKKVIKSELDQIIADVVSRLVSVSSPAVIYLFGSAVADQMTESSDFDFAVIYSNEVELKKYKKLVLNKRLFSDMNIDLLFFTVEEFNKKSVIGGVCWEISRRGRKVYDQRAKI